jgi:hypothetical protein
MSTPATLARSEFLSLSNGKKVNMDGEDSEGWPFKFAAACPKCSPVPELNVAYPKFSNFTLTGAKMPL